MNFSGNDIFTNKKYLPNGIPCLEIISILSFFCSTTNCHLEHLHCRLSICKKNILKVYHSMIDDMQQLNVSMTQASSWTSLLISQNSMFTILMNISESWQVIWNVYLHSYLLMNVQYFRIIRQHIYLFTHAHTYIYIYIERERESERGERESVCVCMRGYVCVRLGMSVWEISPIS